MDCTVLRDEMLAVLYGEADPATVRRVEEHHAVCAACREEMASLRTLRRDLAAWTVPEFSRASVRRPGPRLYRGLAAAAALLLALGGALGLSGAELRVADGRWSFRLGRSADVERLLAEHEARHLRELATLKAAVAALPATAPSGASGNDAALLAKVHELVGESEARQAVVLSASLTDMLERSEAQRRLDLARMSAGFSYLDGRTGQQVARATELMGAVLQASQQK